MPPMFQWQLLLLTYIILAKALPVALWADDARTAAVINLKCIVLEKLAQPDMSKHLTVEL